MVNGRSDDAVIYTSMYVFMSLFASIYMRLREFIGQHNKKVWMTRYTVTGTGTGTGTGTVLSHTTARCALTMVRCITHSACAGGALAAASRVSGGGISQSGYFWGILLAQ